MDSKVNCMFAQDGFIVLALFCHNCITLPSKVTTPQDAHWRLVLQFYLGSNTLEFSAIHR